MWSTGTNSLGPVEQALVIELEQQGVTVRGTTARLLQHIPEMMQQQAEDVAQLSNSYHLHSLSPLC